MNEEMKNILEKVKCLYLKYGIKSVTMDDVSRELGISKKTLYQYVKDKGELVEKVVDLEMQSRKKELKCIERSDLNAIEELLEVNRQVVEMLQNFNPATEYDLKKYYPDLYHRVLESRREHMHQSILENIRKGREEGIYRNNFDADIIAKLNVLRFEHLFQSEIFSSNELSSKKFFRELFIYHIHGIANQNGLKVLENKISEINE
jgi:TetR/AcrR family transcriptional regulator, cholesterol catabolism regulator